MSILQYHADKCTYIFPPSLYVRSHDKEAKIADIFIFKEIIKHYINFNHFRDLYYLCTVIKQTGTGSKLLDNMKYKRLINHFSVPTFVGIKKKNQ